MLILLLFRWTPNLQCQMDKMDYSRHEGLNEILSTADGPASLLA